MNRMLRAASLCLMMLLFLFGKSSEASVTVMHGWPAQQGDTFNKIVAAFEKNHPNIEVVVEVVGRDRPAVLAARLAAGNPPDVTPHPWLGLQKAWARDGHIVPVFPFPAIQPETGNGVPVLVAGDVINCFRKDPEVITFIRFLISREAQEIWVRTLGELSANKQTDPTWFTNPITRKALQILSTARVSRYDASDMMPAAVGTGAFWSGVLDYVSGIPLDTVLETIEAVALDAYSGTE